MYLQEFTNCLKQLDEDSSLLISTMTNSSMLKRFAFNMIELSKFVTIFNEEYELKKAKLDKDMSIMIMDLMKKDGVKYQNKAKNIAENHFRSEHTDVIGLSCILEKAKILYRGYDRLFLVAHTELKYLSKDIAVTNMQQQFTAPGGADLSSDDTDDIS